ncbi:MAG: hypothetical protein HXS54_14180 [Theionarchaea archaeon]|nr:hypothetical protein [Theionarchaea archaeon]
MSLSMLHGRPEIVLVTFFLMICVILAEMGHFVLSFMIILVQFFFLISRKLYIQAGSTFTVMTALLYISSTDPQNSRVASMALLFIATMLVTIDFYKSFLIKRDIKRVLLKMGIDPSSIDVLPYYTEYYKGLYHLKNPVAVKVKEKDTIIKGYFDPEDGPFIVDNPQLAAVYNDIPIEVWKTVIEVHKMGTPKKVEYRDKNENIVGIDVYDERTFQVGGWRKRNGFNEKWDSIKREWNPREDKMT